MSQSKKFKELINNTFELSQTVDGVKTVYVSGSDVEFHIKKHFGNVYCYYDNTTDLKADFDQFNRLHIYDFVRLLQALKFDYNPCENFDKYSDITVSHTGTIGTQSNSTMTSKVNAFDSSSLVTDGETVGSGGNTTTLNNSDGTTEHTHGNIGVQTVSNMILQQGTGEAFLRFNNFVEHYLNRWICGCMVAYGDEKNEIEFSQDTEYATKTELETLAQSTSDDLREVENDIQALDGVVNNLGSDVSNHETRIEALENAPSGEPFFRSGTWTIANAKSGVSQGSQRQWWQYGHIVVLTITLDSVPSGLGWTEPFCTLNGIPTPVNNRFYTKIMNGTNYEGGLSVRLQSDKKLYGEGSNSVSMSYISGTMIYITNDIG